MKIAIVGGAGAMGGALGAIFAEAGHEVHLIDVNQAAVEKIRQEGLIVGADARLMDSSLASYQANVTSGEGVPVVFEATGVSEAVVQGFEWVASGGRWVILGLIPNGMTVSISGLDITRNEATILGSRASSHCFPDAIRMLAAGQISYPAVATTLPFYDGPDVLRTLASDPSKYHKAVLVI